MAAGYGGNIKQGQGLRSVVGHYHKRQTAMSRTIGAGHARLPATENRGNDLAGVALNAVQLSDHSQAFMSFQPFG